MSKLSDRRLALSKASPTRGMLILFRFLINEGNILRDPVLIFALLASITRGGMIFSVNALAGGNRNFEYIALLLACIVATLAFSFQARMRNFRLVEATKNKLRVRLSHQLLHASANFLNKHDHGKVYSIVTQEVNRATRAAVNLIQSLEAIFLIVLCVPYLLYLSWESGLVTIGVVCLGASGYIIAQRPAQSTAEEASKTEWLFFDRVNDILRGYKELRLRYERKRDLQEDVGRIVKRNFDLTVAAERLYGLGQVMAQGAMMLLLTMIVVGLPLVAGTDTSTVLQILTVVLLAYGPIETVLGNLSTFSRATVSMRLIDELQHDLAQEAESNSGKPDRLKASFRSIRLEGLKVTLSNSIGDKESGETFITGPIDLELKPGEVVFVSGGNGAGKSTFLSLLTGLRKPDGGQILLDGQAIDDASISAYRELFSAVFSEFHLFSKLYGLTKQEREALGLRMGEMDITHRVTIDGDSFSTLALSTGQKRRLALAIALAEKRPIIVLDEFAADQDPERRKLFYDILVPQMAAEGHLVIAVTHDEHCFDKCDRLIRMDAGKIVSDTRPGRTGIDLSASETTSRQLERADADR